MELHLSTFFEFRTSLICKTHAPQLGNFSILKPQAATLSRNIQPHSTRQTATMDSDSVKKAIIKQALQATNTANARTLIEVHKTRNHSPAFNRLLPAFPVDCHSMLTRFPEHQREVLRTLRPQARKLPLKRREDVPDIVHGEVHGGVERGQCDLHPEDTAGDWQPEPFLRRLGVVRYYYGFDDPGGWSCMIGDRRPEGVG